MKGKIGQLLGLPRRVWRVLAKLRLARSHAVLKRSLKNVGPQVKFQGTVSVSHPRKVSIGNNVYIGNNAFFASRGGISIGDNVIISNNCSILSSNHDFEDGDALPYGTGFIEKEVTIERNTWIGINVKVCPGVTIGEGAIIGLGSVVTKDVEKLAIVGGNPARFLRYRNAEDYHRLDQRRLYLPPLEGKYGEEAIKKQTYAVVKSLVDTHGYVRSETIEKRCDVLREQACCALFIFKKYNAECDWVDIDSGYLLFRRDHINELIAAPALAEEREDLSRKKALMDRQQPGTRETTETAQL